MPCDALRVYALIVRSTVCVYVSDWWTCSIPMTRCLQQKPPLVMFVRALLTTGCRRENDANVNFGKFVFVIA